MSDLVREWWGRFGAWLTIMGAAMAALACTSLYGPLWVLWLAGSASLGGGAILGWTASTLGGVAGGRSPETSGRGGAKAKVVEALLPLAPVVFVAGLLLLLAAGLDQLSYLSRTGSSFPGNMPKESRLGQTKGQTEVWTALRDNSLWSAAGRQNLAYTSIGDSFDAWTTLRRSYYRRLEEQSPAQTAVLFTALALIGLMLGFSVDINQFSMHNFYRNRLVRCYLGAVRVRARSADPFINFDPRDDQPLAGLAPQTGAGLPYLLVNAALNLSSPELGQQERKAASFVLSPLHCGYFPSGVKNGAFRRTPEYAGGERAPVTLGQAITVSGAAASPNMGFHTSAPLAFLMTVFNVRLGWWIANPARNRWTSAGPVFGLLQLTKELLALANDRTEFVYLSDGGHFENLGLYELLRRRCRYIICADGEEDRDFQFESLGGLIRKAREDFGIEVDIHTGAIAARDEQGRSGSHCVAGAIRYRDGSKGVLLYLKASVTGDEPGDILQYQAGHREFPHQTTGDQFFSEAQFESYRSLGYHVARTAFRPAQDTTGRLPGSEPQPAGIGIDLSQVFLRLRQTWRSGEKWSKETFTKHTERLDSLLERLRTDPDLRFLDRQIYPQWSQVRPVASGAGEPPPGPSSEEAFAKAFYFCLSLIQLMEDVYLELGLEASYDSPDLRGWTNLFHHWTGSGMFQLTYSIAACTFGGQFQSFCERLLEMKTRAVRIGAAKEANWNFHERKLIDGLKTAMPEGAETLPILVETVDAARKPLSLTVGFVVAGGDKLYWIRVQDHLRKMGLGRAALEELRESRAAQCCALAPRERQPDWWERDSEACVKWVERILANQAHPPDRQPGGRGRSI
jgi:hypothetical protein